MRCPTGCLDVGFDRRSLDGLAKTYEELGQSYERLSHRQASDTERCVWLVKHGERDEVLDWSDTEVS